MKDALDTLATALATVDIYSNREQKCRESREATGLRLCYCFVVILIAS